MLEKSVVQRRRSKKVQTKRHARAKLLPFSLIACRSRRRCLSSPGSCLTSTRQKRNCFFQKPSSQIDAKWKTELHLRENKTIFPYQSLHLGSFTLYRIALAPAWKPYRIATSVHTQKWVISAQFLPRSNAAPRLSVMWRVLYPIGVHTKVEPRFISEPLHKSLI